MPPPVTQAPTASALKQALLGESAIRCRPNVPFVLIHHRNAGNSWEVCDVDGAPCWLPDLVRIPMVPGASGFKTVDKGRPQTDLYTDALAGFERRGAIVLHPAKEYGGVKYLDSDTAVDSLTEAPADYWRLWCDTVEPGPLPEDKTMCHTDMAAYNAWRMALVVEGVIPAPHPAVLTRPLRELARIEETWVASNAPTEARDRELAKVRAEIERMKSARKPWIPEPAPAAVEVSRVRKA